MNTLWASSLFAFLALIFLGGSGLLAYEAYAIYAGKDPTISRITAYHFATHPVASIVGVAIVMFVLGALTTHFVNWKPV
jgi:hypothetical protein